MDGDRSTSRRTTSGRLTLVLAPRSEAGSDRLRAVMAALRRSGVEARTLGEVLGLDREYRWFMDGKVEFALRQASRVVVLPRADGSIGGGTVRDLKLAAAAGLTILVVRQDGRLVTLEDAGLTPETQPTQAVAARFTWQGPGT
jgi:hypothetical protein